MTIEEMNYDVVDCRSRTCRIICCYKIKTAFFRNICLYYRKRSEVGAHILSGAILEPSSFNELIPNWKELNAPIKTKVKKKVFFSLTKKNTLPNLSYLKI